MDKSDMEDMERRFEQRFADMERRFEAENKKLLSIVKSLCEKLNAEQIEMPSGGGIGFSNEKPSDNVSIGEEIALAELSKAKQEISKKEKEEIALAELIKAKQEISKKEKELEELKNLDMKRTKTISELLISTSKAEREEARLKVRQDSLRLGSFVAIRAGPVLSEEWEDGPVFSDLIAEQKKLQEETKATEDQLHIVFQKKLQKEREATEHQSRKIRLSDKGDGLSEKKDEDDGIEVELEVYRCRLDKIKREQEAVLKQRFRFGLEKGRLIREMKRIRDEDYSQFNDFRILKDRYALLNLLGKGGFSEVYKAFDLVEHRYVACKLHGVNDQWSEAKKQNYWKHVGRECNIQKTLVHDHIVRLWDSFRIDQKTDCTVLQYCAGKDLDAVLKATPILPESEARAILFQIFKALVYLNSGTQKIIHFDLKPANVLFDELRVAKLTDFGLSKIVENDVGSQGIELTSQGAGTYWYLPPECFDFSKTPLISSKVDVWSAGVLFYQMLFGKRPFRHGQTQQSILHEKTIIQARMIEFPSRPTVSDEAKEFIRRCLTYNQAERPDVLMIAHDPYFIIKEST